MGRCLALGELGKGSGGREDGGDEGGAEQEKPVTGLRWDLGPQSTFARRHIY